MKNWYTDIIVISEKGVFSKFLLLVLQSTGNLLNNIS
jgi:hypothetical protein